MKKIMLYNHGGCGNRGCEAIVRSTAALFAGKAELSLASDQPEFDRQAGLDGVEKIISSVIAPYSVRRLVNSIGFRLGMPREHEVARKHSTVIDLGRRSDVCLSIGGDTYCYNHQEHLQVINGRLRRAGKPLVLWGCSVEPDIIKGETLEDLRAYDLIVARESITEQAMKEAGLPVVRWCDPAFTMETEELPLPDGWRHAVGLNVSPLVLDKAKDSGRALDAFVSLVRHILDTSDCTVALIPHVFWAHDNDLDVLSKIKAQFADEKRVLMLPDAEKLTAPQLKGYIARLSALVTARTHASIAAYSTCVPTLVIGYSVKAKGIARDLFGAEAGHLIPVQELTDENELIAAYDALMARAEQERAFLQERIPVYTAGRDEIVSAMLTCNRRSNL